MKQHTEISPEQQLELNNLLCSAVILGKDIKEIEMLLGQGADVDSKSEEFPLLFYIKDTQVLELFIQKGCNIDVLNIHNFSYLTAIILNDAIEESRKESLIKLLLKNGVETRYGEHRRKYVLDIAISCGQENVVRLLIQNFVAQNQPPVLAINQFLYLCCLKNQDSIAKIIIEEALDAGKLFVLEEERNIFSKTKELLEQTGKFKSADDLENFIKLTRSKFILELAYSTDKFGSDMQFYQILAIDVLENSEDFPKRSDLLEAMKVIASNSKTIKLPNGNHLKIDLAPYNNHGAYFIVEYTADDKPLTLTYCEGNTIGESNRQGYGYGSLTFDLDQEKIKSLSQNNEGQDWLEVLKNDFKGDALEMLENNCKKFYESISNVAVCDQSGHPQWFGSIPTKPQNRGNCSFKSANIALREILRRKDPEMVFADSQGNPGGEGYEVYKNYKTLLTKAAINDLLEIVEKSPPDDLSRVQAIDFFRDKIYPKAVHKTDQLLVEKLKEIFVAENIEIPAVPQRKETPSEQIANIHKVEDDLSSLEQKSRTAKQSKRNKTPKQKEGSRVGHIEIPTTQPIGSIGSELAGNFKNIEDRLEKFKQELDEMGMLQKEQDRRRSRKNNCSIL
jgi:hypothetical protein